MAAPPKRESYSPLTLAIDRRVLFEALADDAGACEAIERAYAGDSAAALALTGDSPGSLCARAYALCVESRLAEAGDVLVQLDEAHEGWLASWLLARYSVTTATGLADAEDLLEPYLDEGQLPVHLARAQLARWRGEPARAEELLDATAERVGEEPVLVERAYIHAALGRPDQAYADLRRARERDPDDETAFHGLQWLLIRHQQNARALSEGEAWLERAPDDAIALINTAVAALSINRPQRALELLDRAEAIAPGYGITATYQALARLQLDDLDGARHAAEAAVERWPDADELETVITTLVGRQKGRWLYGEHMRTPTMVAVLGPLLLLVVTVVVGSIVPAYAELCATIGVVASAVPATLLGLSLHLRLRDVTRDPLGQRYLGGKPPVSAVAPFSFFLVAAIAVGLHAAGYRHPAHPAIAWMLGLILGSQARMARGRGCLLLISLGLAAAALTYPLPAFILYAGVVLLVVSGQLRNRSSGWSPPD